MPKKIFICDDDPDIVEMLEIVLDLPELKLLSETDSRKAYQRIAKEEPDLVLMDLWMPVISGDTVLKEIRASSELKALPVIIMSASKDGHRIAMEAGANDYIAKPFDIDILISKITDMLSSGSS